MVASCSTALLPAAHHSAFLQQVGPDACSTDVVGLVEVDLNQLAKAAAVVVAQRLGIAKRLKNGVGLYSKQVSRWQGTQREHKRQ